MMLMDAETIGRTVSLSVPAAARSRSASRVCAWGSAKAVASLSPTQVRAAYEQLNKGGGVHILARQFPRRRERQPPLPLDGTSTDRQ